MKNINMGISLTIVGMGTVFLVLFLLQMIMTAETWLFSNWLNKPKKDNQNNINNPIATITTTANTTITKTNTTISRQTIAAIMGAITFNTGIPAQKLRLVKVRHLADREAASTWTQAGRVNIINTRSNFYTKGGPQINVKKI